MMNIFFFYVPTQSQNSSASILRFSYTQLHTLLFNILFLLFVPKVPEHAGALMCVYNQCTITTKDYSKQQHPIHKSPCWDFVYIVCSKKIKQGYIVSSMCKNCAVYQVLSLFKDAIFIMFCSIKLCGLTVWQSWELSNIAHGTDIKTK